MPDYCRTQPCNNCPYRLDAPLQYWSIDEFIDLVKSDSDYMGKVYGCHKNDGHVCVGWLIDQDNRNFPSIALRISLSANKVTREFLDKLHCKTGLFKNIKEMANANFEELKDTLPNIK
jgi:Family of unknown function (DUF6283)